MFNAKKMSKVTRVGRAVCSRGNREYYEYIIQVWIYNTSYTTRYCYVNSDERIYVHACYGSQALRAGVCFITISIVRGGALFAKLIWI